VFAVLAAASTLAAQIPVLKTQTEVVRVDVSVRRGRAMMANLTADDFLVRDDGKPRQVTSVLGDRMPVNLLLAFDVSGSVAGQKLTRLGEAGRALIGLLRPGERAALITFSERVDVRVPLTRDVNLIRDALSRLQAHGATSVRDAVATGLALAPADDSRSLLIVFSDGVDNMSWIHQGDLAEALERSGVVMDAVELAPTRLPNPTAPGFFMAAPNAGGARSDFLGSLAGRSGGRSWLAGDAAGLQPAFAAALEDMRSRYTLAFSPDENRHDGWHTLQVTLKSGSADIAARPGYYAPPRK
jgi:VWFA-related protein